MVFVNHKPVFIRFYYKFRFVEMQRSVSHGDGSCGNKIEDL